MAIALSIIFLKTAKPDVGGSLLTLGIAIVLSLAAPTISEHTKGWPTDLPQAQAAPA